MCCLGLGRLAGSPAAEVGSLPTPDVVVSKSNSRHTSCGLSLCGTMSDERVMTTITITASWSQEHTLSAVLPVHLRASHSKPRTSASILGAGGGGGAHRNTASWRAAYNLLLSSSANLLLAPKARPSMTRTAYRLDVGKLHVFTFGIPIY